MTADPIPTEPRKPRRGAPTRGTVIVVGLYVAVGMLWFSSAADGNVSFRPLTTLTAALAVILGLSMDPVRGFARAVVLAATVISSMVLGAATSGEFAEKYSALTVASYIVLLSAIVMSAWLVGAAIRRVGRWLLNGRPR